MKTEGFTFLELLIVITIIALSVSLIYPSFSTRFKGINSDKAVQDFILSLKEFRWDAFKRKEKCEIFSKEGRLWVKWEGKSPTQVKLVENLKIKMKKPWVCLSNGAVTDAQIEFEENGRRYVVTIKAVVGQIRMERKLM